MSELTPDDRQFWIDNFDMLKEEVDLSLAWQIMPNEGDAGFHKDLGASLRKRSTERGSIHAKEIYIRISSHGFTISEAKEIAQKILDNVLFYESLYEYHDKNNLK